MDEIAEFTENAPTREISELFKFLRTEKFKKESKLNGINYKVLVIPDVSKFDFYRTIDQYLNQGFTFKVSLSAALSDIDTEKNIASTFLLQSTECFLFRSKRQITRLRT